MALSASNIKIELREILLKDRPQSLYDVSSKGTVPVLQINDNHIIDESLQIMIWAIEQSKLNWIKISPEQQYKLISINDNDFKFWLNKYKYSERFPQYSFEYYQNKCKQILCSHDQILQHNKYFFSNEMQLADVAVFPLIRQCEHIDSNWFKNTFPNLNRWFNDIKSSNLFLSVMNKYTIWNQKDCGIIIQFHSK